MSCTISCALVLSLPIQLTGLQQVKVKPLVALCCIGSLLAPSFPSIQPQPLSDLGTTLLSQGLLPLIGQGVYLSSVVGTFWRDLIDAYPNPEFCNDIPPSLTTLATIDDPEVVAEDSEQLIPAIKRYAPVLYLAPQEIYYPIWATAWCYGPHTSLMARNGTVIIPEGAVTNDFIQNFCTDYQNPDAACASYYFQNPPCANYGSNPADNQDAGGNLITPCYVITSHDDAHIFLQFMFVYGFNGPYPIGPFNGDIIPLQDAHEFDFEHVTLQINRTTHELQRILYARHGELEGTWISAESSEIMYEDGHPVVFVARSSHGNYPQIGVYPRLYGTGNDMTGKGMRWTPRIIRLYTEYDARYNKSSMAWSAFSGLMGKRGVLAPSGHDWYAWPQQETVLTRPSDSVPFCPASSNQSYTPLQSVAAYIQMMQCILANIPFAPFPPTPGD